MKQNQQQQAFEALLKPILGAAYRLALHLTRSRDEAEDLVQETAILAFRGFHTFQAGTNFKAWYFRIMTNQAIQKYRKNQREPDVTALENVPELFLYHHATRPGSPVHGDNPLQSVLDRIDGERIAGAIAALPIDFRAVAALYFVEELSYQEIAEALGVPIGTVRSRLHRARGLLQKELWQMVEAGEIPPTAGAKRG